MLLLQPFFVHFCFIYSKDFCLFFILSLFKIILEHVQDCTGQSLFTDNFPTDDTCSFFFFL